ncbi:hypothetical protein VHEMI00075 [[Torrubiella] hemipterigena]|uniref:N-acetyltransferase domain-containing protein n=1 Tax=[Torrubiella] hemipterigena TaxID=1531966 RepID=A0A0A1T3D2_9HYPO|nr:hypothetical protein VHEMI00075 [[Torrubiella] hemipterigena]
MSATIPVTPRERVTIRSTLPRLPIDKPPTLEILTERLRLRLLRSSDLDVLHIMRTQVEVMRWSVKGKPNESIDITKKELDKMMSSPESLAFAICLKGTGEMVGIGGHHRRQGDLGWPTLFYTLRSEAWGNGYATEFLKAFLDHWWTLPREEAEWPVDVSLISGDGPIKDELVMAATVLLNTASQGVMRKSGMVLTKIWEEEDLHKPGTGELIQLLAFAQKKPTQ